MNRTILILILILSISALSSAEELRKLTFEQAFLSNGDKLIKPKMKFLSWDGDQSFYLTNKSSITKHDAKTGKTEFILDSVECPALTSQGIDPIDYIDNTKDYRLLVYLNDGDIFLYNRLDGSLERITKSSGEEQNPTLSPDEKNIGYTLAGDLYVYNITDRTTSRLTSDGSDIILNGYSSWIYLEEIYGRSSNYKSYWWSPDSKKIVFIRYDQADMKIFTLVRYSGDYGKVEQAYYPKPGYPNPKVKIGYVDIDNGKPEFIEYVMKEDHYLAFPTWDYQSEMIYFQMMNRKQDTLKIYKYSTEDETTTELYVEKQDSWVELFTESDFIPLTAGDILYRSSKSGWHHICLRKETGEETQLTSGEWQVTELVYADEEKQLVYFSARKEDSAEYDFYSVNIIDKMIERLTSQKGTHTIHLSDNGKYFIDSYENINQPERTFLIDINGNNVRNLYDRYDNQVEKYALGKFELRRIRISRNIELPSTWLIPPDFDSSKRYPVVLRVYGGPETSIVRNNFQNRRERKLMWLYTAQQGIIQIWLDHSGAGHHGKKKAALMHRKLSEVELNDYRSFVDHLKALPYIDGENIAITGGSYGGYISTMANFRYPDYFPFADAGASVTDWRWYDSVWTERYMDSPEENREGYDKSSLFSYVEDYKSGLRITHGTMDDNVQPQHTYRLIEKLIDSGKRFEFMIYPGERHGYKKQKGIYDWKMQLDFWLRSFFGKTIDDVIAAEKR